MTVTATSDTSAEQLDAVLAAAAAAAPALEALGPDGRARLLGAIAAAMDAHADELVAVAQRETHLPEARLRGEVVRTTFQQRLFAEVLAGGGYLQVVIDHPDSGWTPGARPDLRLTRVPIGPALVFGASNFPFAFGTAGGDTASALAAGCPVVVKAHPDHPELSALIAELVAGTVKQQDGPGGTFGIVFGVDAGTRAIVDPRIKVAAFTGSEAGGRALFTLASQRPDPIPFHGELGSLNPVFVTRSAAERRREEIVTGYVDSFTLGVGQFCTKPGLLFVPAEAGVAEAVGEVAASRAGGPMLSDRIRSGFENGVEVLAGRDGVETVLEGSSSPDQVTPTVLKTSARTVLSDFDTLTSECFGPVSIVAGYEAEGELLDVANALSGQLTASVHATDAEPLAAELLAALSRVAGRVIWNGWPTGVAVTWAMQHGGPYPATTSPYHTSVGATAIARFLRPVAFQNVPDELLPPAVKESNPLGLERTVNGRFRAGADK